MTIRGDSYSSAAEVQALTRNLLDGSPGFNPGTIPTLADVEKFIDRASGVLNNAIRSVGIAPAAVRANSTAKLSCDEWVTTYAVMFVELTRPYAGFDGQTRSRVGLLKDLAGDARIFARESALGWKREGVAVADATSQGLAFTGITAPADRTERQDTGIEQPLFTRQDFENPAAADPANEWDNT